MAHERFEIMGTHPNLMLVQSAFSINRKLCKLVDKVEKVEMPSEIELD